MAKQMIGVFCDPDSALDAAGALMKEGFERPEIQSPIPIHGIDEVLGKKKNSIKHFTFFGAITGAITGFVLAAGTAVLYPHPTGGRPLIAIPPYMIITYELLILFGILASVAGFLITARLPAIKERVYVPEAAVDRFAVIVSGGDSERASNIMRDAGAEEVRDAGEAG